MPKYTVSARPVAAKRRSCRNITPHHRARLGITRIFFFGGVVGVIPPIAFRPLVQSVGVGYHSLNGRYLYIHTHVQSRSYVEPVVRKFGRQNSQRFYWLVVDDGSTDETEALIKRFSLASPFRVVYVKQENGASSGPTTRGRTL